MPSRSTLLKTADCSVALVHNLSADPLAVLNCFDKYRSGGGYAMRNAQSQYAAILHLTICPASNSNAVQFVSSAHRIAQNQNGITVARE